MLNIDDRKILDFFAAWDENEKKVGTKSGMSPESFNQMYKKSAVNGSKYIKLNSGTSGHFMVDRKTERVYSIKGYGTPNLKKDRGTIDYLTKFIKAETEAGREYIHTWWYSLHPVD